MANKSHKDLLDEALDHIDELNAHINTIRTAPRQHGVVLKIGKRGDGKKVIVTSKGTTFELEYPVDFHPIVGQTVTLLATGQIAAEAMMNDKGPIVVVKEMRGQYAEIDGSSATLVYVNKEHTPNVDAGHRVVLDSGSVVVVEDLGKFKASQFNKKNTGVTWADIGGLEDIKSQLIEVIEMPKKYPEMFESYGYMPPKGILLEGPPGCGKTLIGKATVSSIEEVYGGESNFLYIKGPEVLSKWVGEAERTIRGIFASAREHKARTGVPSVIFIDEAEALLSARGTGMSSDMERTIVPAFLAEMDGLDENSSLVLLATNRADRLDPAIVRDGRVDRKMTVKRPTMEVATEIARIDFAKYPTTCAAHEIAVRELFDEERKIAEVLTTEGKTLYLRMSDIITGAMITNVARRSSSAAMRRDIAGKKGKPSGISTNDVIKAVNEVETEAKTVSCNAELIAFAKKHQIEVGRYAMVGQG